MIELISAIVPLIQTALWVGLTACALFRYRTSIDDVVHSLHARIEGGSRVKAGPIEIGERIEPQSSESQREEANEEVKEYLEERGLDDESDEKSVETVQSVSYLAEDLALRALQDELGYLIHRNAVFEDIAFVDGVIEIDGKVTLVEVKIASDSFVHKTAKRAASKLVRMIDEYKWQSISVIICLVFVDGSPTPDVLERIRSELLRAGDNVDARIYELSQLKSQFGAGRRINRDTEQNAEPVA